MRRLVVGGTLLLSLAAARLCVAQAQPLPLVDDDGRLHPAWRVVGLPAQQPPLTRYRAERVDGRAALRLEAEASYGNLVQDLPRQRPPRHVAWSWRVERPNPLTDLSARDADDTAAKVCLAFDWPLDRVPFVERQLLRLARRRSGEPLPAATLCWVWGRAEPAGSVLANPYSRRVRYLVLRGQADASARWFDERRDVEADLRRAFGDELPRDAPLPALAAVLVGADADNTRGHSVAQLAELRFER